MDTFLDVLLDSLIDTAKLLPVLLIVYFLIELLEYKNVLEFEKSNLLSGKYSPLVGACFGTVPQCGFSVISAELYSKRKISIAALIAVFIATSDEALPIMIANYKAIPSLLILILTKFILAIISGYLTYFIFSKIQKQKQKQKKQNNYISTTTSVTTTSNVQAEAHKNLESDHSTTFESEPHAAVDEHENYEHHEHLHACCHHEIENQQKFNWKHPLIHSLKIILYIFIVNVILGEIIALVGEDNISNFLLKSSSFQPLFALLVGLIPNCASSVILTELYMEGLLSFGAIVTGLSVNAGIGLFVLFKENKNIKENLFIILMLVSCSLVFGYALHFIPLNFLIL